MAGVVGASLSFNVVVILGIANLLADGFSMGAANYTGTKAEQDEYQQLRHMEERHVALAPEGEREEIRQIFKAKGFEGEALEAAVGVITEHQDRWVDTMMTEEHGMPAVLRSPMRAAIMTFVSFVVCGAVPLAPFVLQLAEPELPSVILAGGTFFAIGSLRSYWSPAPWWRTGLVTLAIGMLAASVAYFVGDFLRELI